MQVHGSMWRYVEFIIVSFEIIKHGLAIFDNFEKNKDFFNIFQLSYEI
jgi:hypothetical protein